LGQGDRRQVLFDLTGLGGTKSTDMLLVLAPSAVGRLNRAIALRQLEGPEAALAELDLVATDLTDYHIFTPLGAELVSAVGRPRAAQAARLRARELTQNRAERSLLERRLFQ
jgi:predicted RNA polymerase sigma factor